jgi:glyoxylase I family protein
MDEGRNPDQYTTNSTAAGRGGRDMIKGLAHLCFVVKDLETSQEFYCDKLGLKPAFDFTREGGERFGMYIHVGGRGFLELFAGEPVSTESASYRHLCLEVDDVETTVADLRGRGVEVSDPELGSDQSYQAWVTDPDGNRIELHGYTPESRQAPHLS